VGKTLTCSPKWREYPKFNDKTLVQSHHISHPQPQVFKVHEVNRNYHCPSSWFRLRW
jgi:hypothetical protein